VKKNDAAFSQLSEAELADNAKKPSYWLKWQRDAGTKEVRGSLWDKAGRYGPFLGGNTQYPLTREEAARLNGVQEIAGDEQSLDNSSPIEVETASRRTRGGRGGR
jgi:hypothetical protein